MDYRPNPWCIDGIFANFSACRGEPCVHMFTARLMQGEHEARTAAQNNLRKGSSEYPIRYESTAWAAARPSLMAQTTRLCPRRMSPAAKTPSTLLMYVSFTSTLPRASLVKPS